MTKVRTLVDGKIAVPDASIRSELLIRSEVPSSTLTDGQPDLDSMNQRAALVQGPLVQGHGSRCTHSSQWHLKSVAPRSQRTVSGTPCRIRRGSQ